MGLPLLFPLSVVVLGGLFFLGLDSPERANTDRIKGMESPEIARAPEMAATEQKAEEEKAEADNAGADNAEGDDTQQKDEADKQDETDQKDEKKPTPPEEVSIPEPVSTDLWLSVPKMGLSNDYVANTDNPALMNQGAVKLPPTGFPWQDNANTYIAAHVLGYSGTGSLYQFAELPSMTYGDVIYLADANGTTYTYEVTEIYTVTPDDTWVTYPEPGRDMVTLQTCINPPAYDLRLVVRADRVDVQTA